MLVLVLLTAVSCGTNSEQAGRVIGIRGIEPQNPPLLSYADADSFCEHIGLQLRAPETRNLEDIFDRLDHNKTQISVFLPEKPLSGSLCSILRARRRNSRIFSARASGSCHLKRHFICGASRSSIDNTPPRSDSTETNSIYQNTSRNDNHGGRYANDERGLENGVESPEDVAATTETDMSTSGTEGTEATGLGTTAADERTETSDLVTTDTTERSIENDKEDTTIAEDTDDGQATTDQDGSGWSGIRTATVVFAPINASVLLISLWALYCNKLMESVRTTLHFHQCLLLCAGQISLIISSAEIAKLMRRPTDSDEHQCNPQVGAQLQFVFLGAMTFTALEGVCLVLASFSKDAPSMSLFYVVIGYSIPLISTVTGLVKLPEHYRAAEQLCILDFDTGAGWLMLGPVIAMIVVNIAAIIVYELRISFLSENSVSFPHHLKQRGRLIRSISLTTFFLGLQWIFASMIQRAESSLSVLFLLFNLATSIAIFVNHVACDRDVRASVARVLGARGKISQRLADAVRPAPPKVDGVIQRVTYHPPPKISENLRSTLNRGMRPSIHLIRPLDHIPVSK